jgi:Flp pilus assembly protein TadD
MSRNRWLLSALVGITVASGFPPAHAKDLKITIPRRSKLTPVQRLNREGVQAVRKHNYSKAEELFYKAYLFDPDDPFTLNNLGYVSELQGQIDRAQKFYGLAAEQSSDATIDIASARRVEGQPLRAALTITDQPLQINHANVEAVRLLSQGRAPEADLLLQGALKTDSQNVFTLNNMAVAKEMEGEVQEALKYYDQAAAGHSDVIAVVTVNHTWRGRPVSEMAAASAKALRNRLARGNDANEQVAELNLRGVSAVNRNDLQTANVDFRKAYAVDPYNAFTLNNIGYVAEIEGDRETAQFFYDRAQQAGGANAKVGVATQHGAEGRKLVAVAADSDTKVGAKVTQERDAMRKENRNQPVALRRRDNSVVDESAPPALPADGSQKPQ